MGEHTGKFYAGKTKIMWSDGDVWTRSTTPSKYQEDESWWGYLTGQSPDTSTDRQVECTRDSVAPQAESDAGPAGKPTFPMSYRGISTMCVGVLAAVGLITLIFCACFPDEEEEIKCAGEIV